MPSYVPPKKNDPNGFVTYISLRSQANANIMQANPILAAGDVKIAIDAGAPANLGTLPAVDADFTKRVKVTLSQAETNGDNLTIIFSDAAGDEWCDLTINIQTSAQTLDEIDTVADAIKAKTDGLNFNGNYVQADVKEISDDSTAADDLELFIENAKGSDHKVLISTDAQDLNATLHVDAKAISASTTAADNVEANITNLNATVSSRSSHTAANVWAVAARALTDKAGFSLAADQSGVTIGTVTTLTGHTAQTGDSYARIGVAGAGLTDLGGMSTGMKAEVQVEANDALVDNNLDHLCKIATVAADMTAEVADNTILSRLLASGDTSVFVPTTDSLQDIRDKQTDIETDTNELQTNQGNWLTATGFSTHNAAAIWSVVTRALTDKAGFSLAADQSGVTIGTVNTLTGHTAQTGDSYARIGVAGAGLSAVPWNSAWDTEVESECNDALVVLKLDHLVAVADSDDPVDNSIIAKLATKGATADWSSFDNTSDSLEALADAIAAAADLTYVPDGSSTIVTGTQIANTYAACATDDGTRWQIDDTGVGDGLDVICEFNLATTRRATGVRINGYFSGSGGPVEIYVYNYQTSAWDKLSAGTVATEMRNRPSDKDYIFSLNSYHTDLTTSPGEVKIRFLTESSNAGDSLYLDYVGVTGAAIGAIAPEVIADAVWKFDVLDVRASAVGEYFAGHVIKRLVALGTDVATANTAISFTLTAGITTDDAYNGMLLEVRDISSATRDIETRLITGWTSGRVVTVDRAYSFTPDVGDHAHITCGYLETMRGTDSAALATALATHDTDIDTQLVAIQLDLNTPNQYKADVSNLDVAVSTRSSHTAANVWAVATRTLTDKAGFTISGTKTTLDALNDITAASVWAVGTRTLSSFGTLVSDIWNELQSGYTVAGSFGKYLDAEVSGAGSGTPATIADAVWDELKAGHTTSGSFGAVLALEATLTDIKGTGFVSTEDSLRLIRQYIDELESGAKPPSKANFSV